MFNLTIVTPTKKIVENLPIDEVIVPGFCGQLDIFKGHAPLVTTLEAGVLTYHSSENKESHRVAISWGYCEVGPTGVSVMAETAEAANEINQERAQTALKNASEKLSSSDMEPSSISKFQRKQKRAEVRLEVKQSSGR